MRSRSIVAVGILAIVVMVAYQGGSFDRWFRTGADRLVYSRSTVLQPRDPETVSRVPLGRWVTVADVWGAGVRVRALAIRWPAAFTDSWGEAWTDLVAIRLEIGDIDRSGVLSIPGNHLELYDEAGHPSAAERMGTRGELDFVKIYPGRGGTQSGWVYFSLPAERRPDVLVYQLSSIPGGPYGAWDLTAARR